MAPSAPTQPSPERATAARHRRLRVLRRGCARTSSGESAASRWRCWRAAVASGSHWSSSSSASLHLCGRSGRASRSMASASGAVAERTSSTSSGLVGAQRASEVGTRRSSRRRVLPTLSASLRSTSSHSSTSQRATRQRAIYQTEEHLGHVVSELRKRRRLFQLLQRRQCPQADVPTGVLEPALDIEECVHFVLTTRAQFRCQYRASTVLRTCARIPTSRAFFLALKK